jgi:hypothetical protein
MSREECREAIEGPAGVLRFTIEPALVNRLLNDMAGFAPWEANANASPAGQLARQADQLPLMQHVLNRLWLRAVSEADGGSVRLKMSFYEKLGGLSGALDSHGAEVVAGLGSNRARIVEHVFRVLVRGATPAVAVREACRLGDLVETLGGDRDSVVAIVEAFRASDCNFLRTSHHLLSNDDPSWTSATRASSVSGRPSRNGWTRKRDRARTGRTCSGWPSATRKAKASC